MTKFLETMHGQRRLIVPTIPRRRVIDVFVFQTDHICSVVDVLELGLLKI